MNKLYEDLMNIAVGTNGHRISFNIKDLGAFCKSRTPIVQHDLSDYESLDSVAKSCLNCGKYEDCEEEGVFPCDESGGKEWVQETSDNIGN